MLFVRQTLQRSALIGARPIRMFAYKASTAEVKKLREMTSSPLGDCIKALNANEGDFDKAKDFLRKKGLAYAEKRSDRFTTQGLIGLKADDRSVSMIQFACETDFVAKTDRFRDGLEAIMNTVHSEKDLVCTQDTTSESLKEMKLAESLDPEAGQVMNIEEAIKFVISKTQENCNLVRVVKQNFDQEKGEVLATYLHNKYTPEVGKIGSFFILRTDNNALNSDVAHVASTLAMHTAAMKPSYLSKEDVPQSAKDQAVEDMREVMLQKLSPETPDAQKQKALAGAEKSAVAKLVKTECLLEQELAMAEGSETVAQFLKEESKKLGANIVIKDWALFQIK